MPIGKLEPFDISSKQWPAYIRRVKQYILLNAITKELCVPLLITVVGEATYALMCDLCSPSHPESKTFEELNKLVSEHLEPQRSEIAERHVFRLRRQNGGEPLTEYLQSLKHLAATCNFGVNLEENLRDQFVSGLANEAMRSRIFAERNIKYKEAVELALALEAAERHAEVSAATAVGAASSELVAGGGGAVAGEGLHQAEVRGARPRGGAGGGRGAAVAGGGGGGGGSQRCWRCGKPHRADRCRFANYNCDQCGVRGHLKVMCKEVRSNRRDESRHKYISDGECEDFYNVQVDGSGDVPYIITVEVNGKPMDFEVDTGSRISTISEDCYRQYFKGNNLTADRLNIRSYVGSKIESMGFIFVNLKLNGVSVSSCKLYVIKKGGRPLLGREWIRVLGIYNIRIKSKEILSNLSNDPFVSQLMIEFPEVFTNKLGTCKKTISLHVCDNTPVYVRARPLALKAGVECELGRLE